MRPSPTGTTVPYNAAFPGGYIQANRHQAFLGYQSIAVMPRIGINWQPFSDGKTVVRGGFGMFSDTFPGLIADDLLEQRSEQLPCRRPWYEPTMALKTGISIPQPRAAVLKPQSRPTQHSRASSKPVEPMPRQPLRLRRTGGLYSAPSFTTTAPSIKYPTYEEYTIAVERKLDSKSTIAVTYAGNHGYHEPVVDGTRNLSSSAPE